MNAEHPAPRVPGLSFDYDGSPPLVLARAIHDAMIDHCRALAPAEACGLIAGRTIAHADALYRLGNELASATRYRADPRDLFQALRNMRANGEHLLAIYHSHPQTAAIPSQTDLRLNYYGPMPRIIVSLAQAEPVVRVWSLEPSTYRELAWSIEPDSVP